MCGISGLFGAGWTESQLHAMLESQEHRGPDGHGQFVDSAGDAMLGHNRLSIIDLSTAGRQPMVSNDGRFWLAFNGELYNYVELRAELTSYGFRTQSDTEVLLAAWERWGTEAPRRFVGMFAFMVWDTHTRTLTAVRDRFGVKPLRYAQMSNGALAVASEAKALAAAGVELEPDLIAWATYLVHGVHDGGSRTFWKGIHSLPAGHMMVWRDGQTSVSRWYDIYEAIGDDLDDRPDQTVSDEYVRLLQESIRLRFRSDVPVGICLSGGLDSSLLLALVHAVQGPDSAVRAYTFTTGDARYDELPWVRGMLEQTAHPLEDCRISPTDVPALFEAVMRGQMEPVGGLPTLAYALLCKRAREQGTIVLLDGQGMDEQWCGYDYYQKISSSEVTSVVQGVAKSALRPECLDTEFRKLAVPPQLDERFSDKVRRIQHRDLTATKLPRALRFNDGISMMSSVELREPFIDHRLVELAMRQPLHRKVGGGEGKVMLRAIAAAMLPSEISYAPKRPLQTPQREWLAGPLRSWALDRIEQLGRDSAGAWFDPMKLRDEVSSYYDGDQESSFHLWQLLSVQSAASLARASTI